MDARGKASHIVGRMPDDEAVGSELGYVHCPSREARVVDERPQTLRGPALVDLGQRFLGIGSDDAHEKNHGHKSIDHSENHHESPGMLPPKEPSADGR